MEEATEGLVLRRFDFGETSQVGHLLTADFGRVAVLAKGIKKPNGALKGPFDLFHFGRLRMRRSRGSDLALLTRWEPVTAHPRLRLRLERLYAAFYLTEIARDLARDEQADPTALRLLLTALAALEEAPDDRAAAVVLAAELSLLGIAGFAPALAVCARCGAAAGIGATAFSARAGGILCRSCRTPLDGGRTLTGGARALALALRDAGPRGANRLRPASGQIFELRQRLFEIWVEILERPLRSAPFVADVRYGFLRASRQAKLRRSGVDASPGAT